MTWSSSALSAAGSARGPLIILVIGAVAISFAGPLVRLSEVGPAATGFYRFLLALPFLWLWMMLAAPRSAPPEPRRTGRLDLRYVALGGLFLGLDLAVWNWAIHLSSVSNATLLGNAAPIWVALAGWLFFRERFTWAFLVGLILAVVGIGLLLGGSFSLSIDHAVGDVLGVIAGVLWGAYIMTIGRLRGRFSTATIMFWGSVVCCPVLLSAALILGEDLAPETPAGWLDLVGLAFVCQVAGQSMVAWALAHLPSSFAAVALLVNPVSATVLAWAILREPVGLQQIVGGVIVLTGILLTRNNTPRAERTQVIGGAAGPQTERTA
ncbi:MAG: DMT family transporter [Dongiaceae bacterium]